jgi:hypothetical protein
MTQETQVALYDDELASLGIEGYVPSSAPSVDFLTLINSTKQLQDLQGSQLGKLFDRATGQNYGDGELQVTVMKVNTTRNWTPDYDNRLDANGNPIYHCRSRDGRRPDAEFVNARSQELGVPAEKVACAICPHSKWKDGVLDCPASYRFTVKMPTDEVRSINCHGMSAKPADKYVQSFVMRKAPLSSVKTKILIKGESNKKGSYFVLGFQALMDQPTTPEERAEVLDWLKTFGKAYDDLAAAAANGIEVPTEGYSEAQAGDVIDTTATTPPAAPPAQTDLF